MNANPISQSSRPVWAVLRIVLIILAAIFLASCAAANSPADKIPVSGSTPQIVQAAQPTRSNPRQTTSNAAGLGGTVAQPAASNVTLAPAPPDLERNPQEAIVSSVDALQKAGPYKTHTTVAAGSTRYENIAEIILPDRFHVISNDQEMLIVGPKSYIKQNGKWISYAVDVSGVIAGLRGALQSGIEDGMSDAQVVGIDSINGSPAAVYQFKEEISSGDHKIKSRVKLWIDRSRGLPVRQEIDGETGGVKTHTIQQIEYDATVDIVDPNK